MRRRPSQLLSVPVLITLVATTCQPMTPEAYNNRGLAHGTNGQWDEAITDFSRALELDPSYAEAFNNRGGMYANKGQYDLAFVDFNRALELNPSYAEAFNNRGFAYTKKGQYDQAIADVNRALELDPSYGMAYNNRGAYMLTLGDTTEACSDAKRGCELGVCSLSNETKSKGVCPAQVDTPPIARGDGFTVRVPDGLRQLTAPELAGAPLPVDAVVLLQQGRLSPSAFRASVIVHEEDSLHTDEFNPANRLQCEALGAQVSGEPGAKLSDVDIVDTVFGRACQIWMTSRTDNHASVLTAVVQDNRVWTFTCSYDVRDQTFLSACEAVLASFRITSLDES